MRKGWEKGEVGEYISLLYGKPLPKSQRDPNGKYPAYGANGVKARTNQFYCDKQSIIIGRKGSAGEVNLTEPKFWPLDVTYYVDFDEFKCDLKFLYYLLDSLKLTRLAKGVKPGINRNDVYAIQVYMPPLAEQKHIAAILDETFTTIDRAVANTEKNIAKAGELFKSVLNRVFDKNDMKWVERKLGISRTGWLRVGIAEVCRSIIDCVNKTAPKVDAPTPYKMIRTTNVRDGRINLESVYYVTEDIYKKWTRRQIPQKGDVILTREAPMGEVGIIETDDCVFLGQRLVSYRVDQDKLNNKFLLFAIRSEDIQKQIRDFGSGSTVQHMRVPDSKAINLLVPTLDDQFLLVDALCDFEEKTLRLGELFQKKLADLVELKQSILQKAIAGELTADISDLEHVA